MNDVDHPAIDKNGEAVLPPLPPWIGEANIAVWDLETTGLEPGKDRITQIAVIHVNHGQPVSEWQTFVNPGIPIPAEVTAITGTTDEMVKHAPAFAEVRAEVLWRLGLRATGRRRLAVAYNGLHFDVPFLRAELLRTSDGVHDQATGVLTDCPEIQVFDPIIAVRIVDRYVKSEIPGQGRHKLAQVAKRHGLEVLRAHGALTDSWMAWGVLRVMASHYYKWGVRSTSDLWPWQTRTSEAQERDYLAYKAKKAREDAESEAGGGGYSRGTDRGLSANELDHAYRDPAWEDDAGRGG